MECASCKADIPDDSRFCIACGAALPSLCSRCGRANPAPAAFCAGCGHRLGAIASGAAPPAATGPAPTRASAERRQLTVMFCDLVGSTALAARLDPEDLREIIGAYQRRVAMAVGRYDGFIAKYMGDGVLVYFGYPRAHEDDAERAVRAGLKLAATMHRVPARGGEELRVRVGIATGLVVVGDLVGSGEAQERGVVGETPNLAARLQALAEPGAVVIAAGTRRLLGGLFECEDLGALGVKGYAEPVRAWRVRGRSAAESRYEALHAAARTVPLVGREEETGMLWRRWRRAARGEGQVVLISGEPGIGKSRLVAAAQERIEDEPHTLLRYFCSPYHQDSALHPVIAHLERAAAFGRDDAPEAKLDKLVAVLAPASPPADDVALLAELLAVPGSGRYPRPSLAPQRKKEKTFEALLRQLDGLARRQPVLMVFEDAHWSDASSRELLDLTVARTAGWPVLLLITFRPEFDPPWVGQPHVTVLTLSRLDRRDGAALVRSVLGDNAVASDLVEEIVERTDGVPLFIEELTKAVLEAGETGAEAALATTPSGGLSVPPTLHASLMARLDRLGPAEKEVAQVGAAIGREFSYELLSAVADRGANEVQAALGRLVEAGLLFRRGTPPEASYTFKHALVQDASYGTLLRAMRQQLHARIAAALERRFPETAEIRPEVMARHFTEAGLLDGAVAHWRKAGEQAVRRAANREAIEHFRRALSLNDARPDGIDRRRTELAVLSQLGPALMSLHGWPAPEVGAAFERAGEVARQLESSADLAPPLVGLWLFHISRGQFARAETISDELFRIAQELEDPELLLQAHHSAWPTCYLGGRLAKASEHIDAGMALYDEARHERHRYLYLGHDPAVCALAIAAPVQWLLGYPDRAVRLEREASELARRLRHAPSLAHALWFIGECQFVRGDVAAVAATAAELLALCEEHRLPQPRATALMFLGWAAARAGDVAEGTRRLEEGLGVWNRLGARSYLPRGLCLLAESRLLARRHAEGLELVARALAVAAESGEAWYAARLHQLRAELLQALGGDADAAEASLLTALDVARAQGARGWERRVAASLARHWLERGRREDARTLLAATLPRFAEGRAAPAPETAEELLDRLGG
jgi:predicted ATPase/class 3 adenylate cyclase